VLSLALQCFGEGHTEPDRRPPASQWVAALTETGREAVTCAVNPRHAYHASLPTCPWCSLTSQRDPYGEIRTVGRPAPKPLPAPTAAAPDSNGFPKILLALGVAVVVLLLLIFIANGS
jgi:hypothetical protein